MSASSLQSDATSADSLHADDTAECHVVATGAGVQSLPFNGLQDAPEGATPHVRHVTSDAAPEPALFAAALGAENDDEHEYVVEIDGPVLSATIDAPWAPESPAVTAADTVGDEVVARLGDGESPSLLPDERIAFVPTDAAWKRHDEQLALRTGLALLTNEEHTQVAAWVSMRTAGRS